MSLLSLFDKNTARTALLGKWLSWQESRVQQQITALHPDAHCTAVLASIKLLQR